MVDSLNLSNLSVDENGRVTISGIGSGINFVQAVDDIIAARRIPVDRLEASIELNSQRITAFEDLRSLLNNLSNSLNALRGQVTFGGAGDIFQAKDVFASTTSSSGTATAAAGLIGVNVTNAAATGSNTLEILQIATAQKLSTGAAASNTDDLGVAFGGLSGSINGAFEINGRRISVEASDSLIDLADRINTANSGLNATGVTASVVTVSATENILTLTADDTGEQITIAISHRIGSSAANSTSDDLGMAFGGASGSIEGAFEINGVQIDAGSTDSLTTLVAKINAANTGATASIITVGSNSTLAITTDNASQQVQIAVAHRIGSGSATDTTSDLGTAFGMAANSIAGTFDVNGQTITIVGTDTLETLRDKINAAGAGATAKIITNGANDFNLAITSDDASQQVAITNETGGVLTSLGISNDGGTTFLNELSVSKNVLTDMGISNDGGATFLNELSTNNDVLAALEISNDGGTTFLNELRAATNARFKANGLIDFSAFQTVAVASASTAFNQSGTLAIQLPDDSFNNITVDLTDTPTSLMNKINGVTALQDAGISATVVLDSSGNSLVEIRQSDLTVTDASGVQAARVSDPAVDDLMITGTLTFDFDNGQIAQIAVNPGDTMNNVATAINGNVSLQNAGVSAQVVADGSQFKLVIQHDTALTATGPAGLGLAKPELIIERQSNTVSDLFGGITVTLFQAEVNTTIKLDVEQNLGDVKQAVLDFVDAYNTVKSFINQQRLSDPTTGAATADTGPLFSNPALSTIEQSLSKVIGQGAQGLSSGFRVLQEIGITFVDNDTLADPLLADTLVIDETILDQSLLNDPDKVERLFDFDFSASDPRIALLSFTGQSQVTSGGYSLDVTVVNGVITAATIDGVANSTTISGNVITATNATTASGLQMFFNGTTSATNIQLDFSAGIASGLFFEVESILDSSVGVLQSEIDNFTQQNDLSEARTEGMLDRLASQRDRLLQQFIAMETALSSMRTTLEAIKQQVAALNPNN